MVRECCATKDSSGCCEEQWTQEPLAIACRLFYTAWQTRNEKLSWRNKQHDDISAPKSNLDTKIHHLRREIAALTALDAALFRQLFQLQDSIDELKESRIHSEQCDFSPTACQGLSESQENQGTSGGVTAHTSFVRQRVSYPPSARNRCRRSHTLQLYKPASSEPCAPPQATPAPPRRPRSAHSSVRIIEKSRISDHPEIFV